MRFDHPLAARPVRAPLRAAALCALAGSGAAATLRVPADYATIQAAIDVAVGGDEVLVAPGVYPETIDFLGKGIAVRSEAGAARTTISGGGAPVYVVRFDSGEGADSLLEGFTITGGVGPQGGSSGPTTGGVLVLGASPVLAELVIAGNAGVEGGGVHVSNGAPLVVDSLVADNAAHTGGGLYTLYSDAVLEGVRIEGNTGVYGGGGLWAGGGTIGMDACGFLGNTVGSFGGGLMLNHVQVDAVELLVEGNGEAQPQPDGSTIFLTFGGGGMYTTQTSGRVDRSIFRENVAAAGGGVYIAGSGTLELVNCLSAENLSGIAGAGVYTNGSSPRLIHCTVARNFPGGLFSTYASFPTVRNSILAGNGDEVYVGVDVYGNGNASLAYSLVQDPVLTGGTLGAGMLQGDPQLAGDYSLLPLSPAIDAADNAAVPAGIKLDLDGMPRFLDDPATPDTGVGPAPVADMGALELVPPGAMPVRARR